MGTRRDSSAVSVAGGPTGAVVRLASACGRVALGGTAVVSDRAANLTTC